MPSWLIWVVVAVALAIGEILTPGLFFLGPLALAAGAAAIVAAAGGGMVLQPAGLRRRVGRLARSAAADRPFPPAPARLDADGHGSARRREGDRGRACRRLGGRVKIGGEVWSARTLDEHQVIEPGARVEVAQIEGATAVVYE